MEDADMYRMFVFDGETHLSSSEAAHLDLAGAREEAIKLLSQLLAEESARNLSKMDLKISVETKSGNPMFQLRANLVAYTAAASQ